MPEATDTHAAALDAVDPEHILAITRWAAKHGAAATFSGRGGGGG